LRGWIDRFQASVSDAREGEADATWPPHRSWSRRQDLADVLAGPGGRTARPRCAGWPRLTGRTRRPPLRGLPARRHASASARACSRSRLAVRR
jgi:hypothetical protein